jgi:hypothetical protein
MSNEFGIYKTRIPIENITADNLNEQTKLFYL